MDRQLDLFEVYDPYLPERHYKLVNGEYPDYVYEVVASTGLSSDQLIKHFGGQENSHLL